MTCLAIVEIACIALKKEISKLYFCKIEVVNVSWIDFFPPASYSLGFNYCIDLYRMAEQKHILSSLCLDDASYQVD
jgi:hypothetical protein